MSARIVVLGGGFGGITAALELAGAVGELATVTLVDRDPQYAMGLTKLWVATGARSAEESMRSRELLSRRGIEFVLAEVTGIDASSKTVETSVDRLPYDKLIIALGLNVDPSVVPGLSEHGSNLYSMEGAQRIAQELGQLAGDLFVAICGVPFKCPPAPYEAAMMIGDAAKKLGSSVRIEVVTPEPRPMPVLPPEAGERVVGLLEERSIQFSPGYRLVSMEPGLASFENGEQRRFDALIAVPPHRPPALLAEVPGLTDDSGFVTVDRHTLATPVADVYAVGDVAKVLTFTGMPIPRAGILAESEARVVASNLAAELRGDQPAARFDGRGYCFVEVGGGEALKAEGEFLADPHPVAHFADRPSADGYREKLAFESVRLRDWFGG